MAEKKYELFLDAFYKRWLFDDMPLEQYSRFCDYVKNDDLVGKQKEWAKELLEKNAAGEYELDDTTKLYKKKTIPQPDLLTDEFHMEEDEWKDMYKAFHKVFLSMSANRDDDENLKNNTKALEFLDTYFGLGKPFDATVHVTDEAKDEIKKLETILKDTSLRPDVEKAFKQEGVLKEDDKLSDFIKAVQSGDYITKPDIQTKIQKAVHALAGYYGQTYDPATGQVIDTAPFASFNLQPTDDASKDWFQLNITPANLTNFKATHRDILKTLHKKEDVYNAFNSYGGTKITKHLDNAKSWLDYNDTSKDEYLTPKREDEITFSQRISDFCSDTYTNYLEKYIKFQGDRLFFSDDAKLIFTEIDKKGIKPTDGIQKILDSKDEIAKSLKVKKHSAEKSFSWFCKTMNELKNTMPKAFAGALQNGRQLRALVSELIVKAVKENKIEEAKASMELLSVIKYGYTTSKIMDALKKEEFTIFSDKGLSWNKNEGIKFITTAMDKSIKYAFLGIGYGMTMVGNALNLNGSKFNGERDRSSLKTASEQWAQQNQLERDNKDKARNTLNAAANKEIAGHRTVLGQLASATINPVDTSNIDVQRQNRERLKQTLDSTQQIADQNNLQYNKALTEFNTAKSNFDEQNDIVTQHTQLQQNVNTDWPNQKTALEAKLNDPATYDNMPPAAQTALAQSLQQQIDALNDKITQGSAQLADPNYIRQVNDAQTALPGLQTNMTNAQNALHTAETNKHTADTNLQNAQTDYDALNGPIQEFESATAKIEELQNQINKRNEEMANWDENHRDAYKDLMAYWDMLETGRDSHTGSMYSWTLGSKKLKQKNFARDDIIADALNSYRYR